jgi:GNAT superfamily N-acetyltransferase
MPTIIIRDAEPGDVPTILRFVRELAMFENELEAVVATEADFLRDGFGPARRFFCRIALLDDAPAGFTLWFRNYSTWQGRAGLYIEDLYVTEAARGQGVGRRLLADLARIAIQEKAGRIDLSVLHWNPARGFYEAAGLTHRDDWLPYRIEGAAIAALATEIP